MGKQGLLNDGGRSGADQPFPDPAVRKAFDRFPEDVRGALLHLRALIFRVAAETDDVGPLQETLKWGEPSYLTARTGAGTTIRISHDKNRSGGYALFVHCQTGLLERYRAQYSDLLHLDGNRAIRFHVAENFPEDAVCHCIAMALTYHRDKKRKTR